jgi:hypothetical protein
MLRLRGHHLVCLHFFRGEGYSEEFVRHLSGLMARAEGGEPVEIVAGADDLCRACPWLAGDACAHKEGAEAEIREMDASALRLQGVSVGDAASWAALRERLPEVMPEWRRAWCRECEWREVCEEAGQEPAGGA